VTVTRYIKSSIVIASLVALAAAWAAAGTAMAQGAAPAASGTAAPAVAAAIGFDKLKGTWVRPDGGYRIVIGSVGADGRIEAMYFNPNQLPFARAQASMAGAQLRASFELRAGGYDGSTYELAYDPASDRLQGVYYQAVIKQKFDVYFSRR
jgi:uncharacterized protein (DUF2147 family)